MRLIRRLVSTPLDILFTLWLMYCGCWLVQLLEMRL
jgi:hypothetical protein